MLVAAAPVARSRVSNALAGVRASAARSPRRRAPTRAAGARRELALAHRNVRAVARARWSRTTAWEPTYAYDQVGNILQGRGENRPLGSIPTRLRWLFQGENRLDFAAVQGGSDRDGIIYEEYHPYGTSAYRSAASGVEVSARRYRHTGKERDEETGLYHMGARYYACWLARWTSADPLGIGADGPGLYNYVRGSPIGLSDPSGMQATEEERAKADAAQAEENARAKAADREQRAASIRKSGEGVTLSVGIQKGGTKRKPLTAQDVADNAAFSKEASLLAEDQRKKRETDPSVAYAVSAEDVTRRSSGKAWDPQDVNTGAELIEYLKDATAQYGSIKNLVIYGHGTGYSLVLDADAGLYADVSGYHNQYQPLSKADRAVMEVARGRSPAEAATIAASTPGREGGARTLDDLRTEIAAGTIKFADDAMIQLIACSTATNVPGGGREINFARELAIATGVSVVGAGAVAAHQGFNKAWTNASGFGTGPGSGKAWGAGGWLLYSPATIAGFVMGAREVALPLVRDPTNTTQAVHRPLDYLKRVGTP